MFYYHVQVYGKIAADFALHHLWNLDNEKLRITNAIPIYLAVINADPDWDPSALLSLIHSLSRTNRILLLAGINLTYKCVSAHDHGLFFVMIQSDRDNSNTDEEGQEDEESNSPFKKLKNNLEGLIKKCPRLLVAKVLLCNIVFFHLCCLLITYLFTWSCSYRRTKMGRLRWTLHPNP